MQYYMQYGTMRSTTFMNLTTWNEERKIKSPNRWLNHYNKFCITNDLVFESNSIAN